MSQKFLTVNFGDKDNIVTFLVKLYEVSPSADKRPKVRNVSEDKGITMIIELPELQAEEARRIAKNLKGRCKMEV
jgi:hypothetical protein